MPRKKNSDEMTSRTFKLPNELLERMDAFSEETGISRTFIVRCAIKQYLDSYDAVFKQEDNDSTD